VQKENPTLNNNEVSKIIGKRWKEETQDVTDHFHALSQEIREEQQRDFPYYKYPPRQKGKRKRRNIHPEIISDPAVSKTEETTGFDLKPPPHYGMASACNGDSFSFSYCQDVSDISRAVESPNENESNRYNLPSIRAGAMPDIKQGHHGLCMDPGPHPALCSGYTWSICLGTSTIYPDLINR
jgi:hypothetical protein